MIFALIDLNTNSIKKLQIIFKEITSAIKNKIEKIVNLQIHIQYD